MELVHLPCLEIVSWTWLGGVGVGKDACADLETNGTELLLSRWCLLKTQGAGAPGRDGVKSFLWEG